VTFQPVVERILDELEEIRSPEDLVGGIGEHYIMVDFT